MIEFKKDHMREEFIRLDIRLKRILYVLDALLMAKNGVKTVVTSVFREGKGSPHNYYRGIDVRSRDLKQEECIYLVNILNFIFPYGKEAYQTVLFHDVGSGYHFHIQVKAE